jgi:hypothetical protein
MITTLLISFLVGAALAQRFKVMVLMPATVIVLVLAAGTGVTRAQTAWSIILMAVTAGTSLQIGYLAGLFIRHALVAALSRRPSPLTSPETPARHAAR